MDKKTRMQFECESDDRAPTKKYDFDGIYDRRATHSVKWNVGENELPMWIADMDFMTAPAIREAVVRRAQMGIFGYTDIPDEWYDAITDWWKNRHSFEMKKEWLCFCTGVIPAITSAVKRLSNHGDNVVVQTPVYDIFFHSVENSGRHVLESKLKYDGENYSVDYADLEKKLSERDTTLMILCNPHNPVGKVWTRAELQKVGELCAKYGVTVISDEIHCDLTDPGVEYTPFASASEVCRDNSVTCVAASKAFNLAGLQAAATVIPNPTLRNKIVRGLNSDEVAETNCFGAIATIAAFREGGEWLDELREYVGENKRLVKQGIRLKLPQLRVVEGPASYLLWIDCGKITDDAQELEEFIRRETGLYLTAGGQYRGNGKTFVRMNLACQRARAEDGLERLIKGVTAYAAKK